MKGNIKNIDIKNILHSSYFYTVIMFDSKNVLNKQD